MKYVVVGTSHAGYAVIETLLISDPEAEIEVFESAEAPSFLSCGIYWLFGQLYHPFYANDHFSKYQIFTIFVLAFFLCYDC